jgi:hypothetical protein
MNKLFFKYCFLFTTVVVLFAQCIKNKHNFRDGYEDGELAGGPGKIDTSLVFIDVSKYAAANTFPGLACPASEQPRLKDQNLTMNFNYRYISDEELRISVPPQPQFSTGFYAAPGELVIVDVPSNIQSLAIQIGAWRDNLSAIEDAPRDPLIYSLAQLSPGRNYVRNLYGGPIYLTAVRPIEQPVTLKFTNVLKMADFVLESGMSDADWKAQLNTTCAPWLELRSKHIIFTISKEYCLLKPISDVKRLMTRWDEIIKRNYYDWEGLSDNPADPRDQSPLLPWRVVLDIKPSVGYLHSGYPVVGTNDFEVFDEITNFEQRVSRGITWGILHEIGHNNQQGNYWSWGSLVEVTCNLFSCREAKLQGFLNQAHPALPTQIPQALAFAADAGTKDFDGTDVRIKEPFQKLAPFMQIMFKYPNGDSLITKLYQAARRALRRSNNDQDKRDFLYETICDATKLDWALFFDKWGIRVSNVSANKIAAKGYLYYTKELWKYNPLTGTGGDTQVDLYSRSNWSIVNFSSQELTGEGPPSGLISAILDNNPATFWHSVWSTASATPPHHFTVDMKVPFNINGFFFTQRQSLSRNLKNVKVEVSLNGTTWEMIPNSTNPTSATTFTLQSITAQQNFTIPTKRFRYFRVTVPTSADVFDGTNNAALAEVGVIY